MQTQHTIAFFGTVSNSASIPLLTATFVRPDELMDVPEAAAKLHFHPVTIRLKAAAGDILGPQIGNAWRFSRKRVTEWVQSA
jgi:hypothetical protein